MDWLWWVGAALVLGVLEMLSLDLVLIMFAGGALAGALANALGAPIWLQIVVFAVMSVVLLVALRPWLLRRLKARMPLEETNAAPSSAARPSSSPGRASGGRVKLAGEVWSARAADEDARSRPATEVRVSRIDGRDRRRPVRAEHPAAARLTARPQHRPTAAT